MQLLLAQYASGIPPITGPNTPSPTVVRVEWYLLLALLTLLLFIFCLWLFWRVRVLTRAMHELKADSNKPVHIPGPFGFARFKLRTLLIILTLVAIPLGLFMAELRRAQRQGQIMDRLSMSETGYGVTSGHYRLGKLGSSKLAGLLCDWVHPHFGCRLDALSLSLSDDSLYPQPPSHYTGLQSGKLAFLSDCPDIQMLYMENAIFTRDDIEQILKLPNLQRLDIRNSHLPQGTLNLFTSHPKLTHLTLIECQLEDQDLKDITPNERIDYLNLSYNKLEGHTLTELAALKGLQQLDLAGNSFERRAIQTLPQLPALKQLNVAHSLIDSIDALALASIPTLEILNLTDCGFVIVSSERSNIVLDEDGTEQSLNRNNPQLKILWDQVVDSHSQEHFHDNRPSLDPSANYYSSYVY